ncbi:Chromosome partitioning ATPase, Mrp family, containings Fe-S cluster [Nostoc flagelliforme CCNUN1]|uniref:Chromosome partitioning ATPase, Mrp family, containings Fe-S cluster n=1 Tax=Nostoc flagelliforme CCNUN1 TaxID=2038116 RepID=A0A2K8SQY2_9NOSO|nr:hypothetical protein [Nostoc flagelliforme]AUB37818.1 Chromosome partitioning ATPase, Mrp family, containings Fe-S cluster [Nostoc flagelliforme CCNUN1]
MNLKGKHGKLLKIDDFLKLVKVKTVKDTDVLVLFTAVITLNKQQW